MSLTFRGLLALFVGLTLGLSLSLGGQALADRETRANDESLALPWQEARLLAEVLERVKRDYVDTVDDEQLIEAAIRGMVADLDAHSSFLDTSQYREMRISTTGNYSGVGLEVNMDDGAVRVVSPIDDTPAAHAGILPGDIIMMVDEQPVDSDNLNATVDRMRGAIGSEVRLTIARDDEPELLNFTLRRARIAVASVSSQFLEPGYAYLRISTFSETTGRDLTKAIVQLQRGNQEAIHGLVLDLRNNPGGVLDAAVSVSDAFLDAGVIVSADGRVAESRFELNAERGDLISGADIVVLVNAGSASAAEIVAGALQDHKRAVIIGDVTYGKGSVQTVMPLSYGRAIKLTTSRYYTPSGRSIHGVGISPDIPFEPRPKRDAPEVDAQLPLIERDAQVAQALRYLKSNAIVQSKVD